MIFFFFYFTMMIRSLTVSLTLVLVLIVKLNVILIYSYWYSCCYEMILIAMPIEKFLPAVIIFVFIIIIKMII